ncbi:hypothetical protein B0T17DRAFT_47503 [Bombardia bombarda]|uniref:Uncharacterized protein n=1 Tax=Bombardia bombarda TaxID=252184 RepID=A0AA40CFI3_9PEZI|nr:hypothetical protein B0T17DRAFT_47503 [Bombardia bombarda]
MYVPQCAPSHIPSHLHLPTANGTLCKIPAEYPHITPCPAMHETHLETSDHSFRHILEDCTHQIPGEKQYNYQYFQFCDNEAQYHFLLPRLAEITVCSLLVAHIGTPPEVAAASADRQRPRLDCYRPRRFPSSCDKLREP